ncbi:MAG: sodium:proton antiporter [Candidatus Omnitrophica bacterium]|nr:sodium:proton antiporter [Candidatus Omnitrophota bacterium]
MNNSYLPYFLCLVFFCVGLYGVLRKRNIIKIIIGLVICEYAVNLFLVLVGYKIRGRSPLYSPEQSIIDMVDPLPQALVLTSIVIGLATTALVVGIAIRIYEKYDTFDITRIRKLKG